MAVPEKGAKQKLRVRTGKHYPVNFCITLGQENAEFIKKPQTPLARYFPWADAFGFYPGGGYDITHTINAIPILSRKKFIVTFEDYLPRTPEDRGAFCLQKPLRKILLSKRCIKLLAMSQYGLGIFKKQNAQTDDLEKLLVKTEVLYPAVPIRNETPKKLGDTLRLCFVGSDFMRKGCPVLTRAHESLRKNNIPVETHIVSSLRWSEKDYIGPPNKTLYEEELKKLSQDGIILHKGLANDEVLQLMQNSDFLIFPTFHDTFGFVSIEAMSCATPVITNATCAQLEIVENGISGHLLSFENDQWNRWKWLYKTKHPNYIDAYISAANRLAAELGHFLTTIWDSKSSYVSLSAGAIETIRRKFDIQIAKTRLEEIYETCR